MAIEPSSIEVVAERSDRELHQATRRFAQQSATRSWRLVGSTFALLACALVTAAIAPPWSVRLVASTAGALLLVRTFILYHDGRMIDFREADLAVSRLGA